MNIRYCPKCGRKDTVGGEACASCGYVWVTKNSKDSKDSKESAVEISAQDIAKAKKELLDLCFKDTVLSREINETQASIRGYSLDELLRR